MINRETYLTVDNIKSIKNNVALYGAGTQSTGMILMALVEKECALDFAIFSDTGAEPDHVIEYKEYFTEFVFNEFGFKIYTVKDKNLDTEIREYLKGNRKRVSQIPLFTDTGILIRQCTQDYKIAVADKFIKNKYSINRKNSEQSNSIAVHMGISIDEIQRLKKSTQWWKTIVYPLIEKGMRRNDTINMVKKYGLKEPPRSACYFCPFHSNDYWGYLYNKYPLEYKKAIEFDELIRNYPKMNQKCYLHRSRKPLKYIDYNQTSFIDLIDECYGYCGM